MYILLLLKLLAYKLCGKIFNWVQDKHFVCLSNNDNWNFMIYTLLFLKLFAT